MSAIDPKAPGSRASSEEEEHDNDIVHDLPALPAFPRTAPQLQPTTDPTASTSTAPFSPLALTASRLSQRSVRTFADGASMISVLPDLGRIETRASRVGKGFALGVERRKRDEERGSVRKDGDVEQGGRGEMGEEEVDDLEEEEKVVAVQITPDGQEFTFPDGGKDAWLCLVGAWCALFVGFGLIPAAGAFQTYYRETFLSDYTSSQVAWIGSLQAALAFGSTAFTGGLFDKFGAQRLVGVGTLMVALGYCMISLSSKYYQFLLCHALVALGQSLLFISPMAALGQWWALRRGMAFGIATTGGAFGAGIWPIVWSQLPPKIGFGWTMRLIALISLVLGAIATILLRTRLPPKPPGPFFHLEAFRGLAYCSLTFATFAFTFAFFIWTVFISTYAKLADVGTVGPYLLTIMNAGSVCGRLLTGYTADRIGAYNNTIIASWVQVVLTFAWLAAKSAKALVAVTVFYGFAAGVFISLQAPMITRLADDMRFAGTMIGQSLIFQAAAQLISPPIGGALLGKGTAQQQLDNFPKAILLAAAMQILAAAAFTVGRWKLNKELRGIV